MKPALLNLKLYTDPNLQKQPLSKSLKNSFVGLSQGKKKMYCGKTQHQMVMSYLFKKKLPHQRSNIKEQQTQFKMPKSFSELKNKIRQNQIKKFQHSKQSKSTYVTRKNSVMRKPVMKEEIQHVQTYHIETSKDSLKENKLEESMLQRQAEKQILKEDYTQQMRVEENILQKQQQNLVKKSQIKHFKLDSLNMQKLGYRNLEQYLNLMQKTEKIRKNLKKSVQYHPLGCMKVKSSQNCKYNEWINEEKQNFRYKMNQFRNKIKVCQNFTVKKLEILIGCDKKQVKSIGKSRFNKIKYVNDENTNSKNILQKTEKNLIINYDSVIVVNLGNKNFFQFTFSKQPSQDYHNFFRYTTPLLDKNFQTRDIRQSQDLQNLERKKLSTKVYFCSLFNRTSSLKQLFFWVGKPVQYYKKQELFLCIQNFLKQTGAIQLFDSDRISIIDVHGKTSFINKEKFSVEFQQKYFVRSSVRVSRVSKDRVSKRISNLSRISLFKQLQNTQSTAVSQQQDNFGEMFGQFSEQMFLKKSRTNINTRGQYRMLEQPIENVSILEN